MTSSGDGKYRVGLIGCGRQGTGHGRAYMLNPMTELVAGADTDPENLQLFRDRFNLPGYDNYQEMIEKERIDIVAPILPVRANADIVVGSAEAGVKAIFCEKPLCASLEDADRMVEACSSRGIPFAAGLVPRNQEPLWKAREMIEAGEIGEVQSINLYHSSGQGGCRSVPVMRMFAHDASVEWVVGSVEGDPHSDEQTVTTGIGGYVKFTNGIDGFFHYKTGGPKVGVEVVGSRGIFASDWQSYHLWKISSANSKDLVEVEGLFPDYRNHVRGYDDEGWQEIGPALQYAVQSVVDALEKGTETSCSGAQLREALEIVIAMRESARNGNSRVTLPLADRSLKIMPIPTRWNYKKEIKGVEWYRESMKAHKR